MQRIVRTEECPFSKCVLLHRLDGRDPWIGIPCFAARKQEKEPWMCAYDRL